MRCLDLDDFRRLWFGDGLRHQQRFLLPVPTLVVLTLQSRVTCGSATTGCGSAGSAYAALQQPAFPEDGQSGSGSRLYRDAISGDAQATVNGIGDCVR